MFERRFLATSECPNNNIPLKNVAAEAYSAATFAKGGDREEIIESILFPSPHSYYPIPLFSAIVKCHRLSVMIFTSICCSPKPILPKKICASHGAGKTGVHLL